MEKNSNCKMTNMPRSQLEGLPPRVNKSVFKLKFPKKKKRKYFTFILIMIDIDL